MSQGPPQSVKESKRKYKERILRFQLGSSVNASLVGYNQTRCRVREQY